MSEITCTCESPKFGHVGRPACVITQKALAFPMFSPRFRENGTRNYIPANTASITAWLAEYGVGFADINTALGTTLTADNEITVQHVIDWRLSPYAPTLDRLYPSLRVENATFPRTDTTFETAPSGRKIKIEGVGGIRTWAFELWGKDAAHGVLRAYKVFGCTDLDAYYVDVAGNNWGIMDDSTSGILRGYEMSTETFEAFIAYATDTTAQKIMLSFDLDAFETEANSWAITLEEYGKKFTTISPLIQGFATLLASILVGAAPIVINATMYASFGSAGNKHDITGLLTGNFTLKDSVGADEVAAGAWASVTENPDGTYALTSPAAVAAGTYTLETKANGYQVPDLVIIVV